jgi:hypothetical protein
VPIERDTAPIPLVLLATGTRRYSSLGNAMVRFGSQLAPVALITERSPGLEEIRVMLPKALEGKGVFDVQLIVDGEPCNVLSLEFR